MDGILEVPAERKLKETFPGTELNATWTALGDGTLTLPIGTLTNSPKRIRAICVHPRINRLH